MALLLAATGSPSASAQVVQANCILPEQRSIYVRRPNELAPSFNPASDQPKTIADYERERETFLLSLDQAIELALRNAEVIRVLQGTTAGSTGSTIYDPAIQNTQVDVEQAQFDPNITAGMDLSRNESPSATFDPADPGNALIQGADVRASNFRAGLTERKISGGRVSANVSASPTDVASPGLPLNPRTPTSLDLSYTHPLLRGRGVDVNLAPVVIARLNTERSFYQLKDGVQQMVRSVIDGYWQLVAARVRLWSLEQQVEQLEFAFKFFDAQRQVGRVGLESTLQAEVSLANFRASLISARAEVLDREAAFFNVLGMPPRPDLRLIPTTPPIRDKVDFDWDTVVATASENRPDLIQLKLDLESDQERLRIACNNTLPQLDAVGLFRMNGLGGQTPNGGVAASEFLQFNDLQVGLSLQTPFGQRAARAQLRQNQLSFARDQALFRQQLHAVTHNLASSVRNLELFFAQYEAFQKVREASRLNLKRQLDVFRIGGTQAQRINYLNVLQAVTDWGNSINSEAASLAQYNGEIASLYLSQGTILEEHGIVFQEECYGSVGPFGVCTDQPYSKRRDPMCTQYPHSVSAGPNDQRYTDEGRAAEESFGLEKLSQPKPARTDLKDVDIDAECKILDTAVPDGDSDEDDTLDAFDDLRDLKNYKKKSPLDKPDPADMMDLPDVEELPELRSIPKSPIDELNKSLDELLKRK